MLSAEKVKDIMGCPISILTYMCNMYLLIVVLLEDYVTILKPSSGVLVRVVWDVFLFTSHRDSTLYGDLLTLLTASFGGPEVMRRRRTGISRALWAHTSPMSRASC